MIAIALTRRLANYTGFAAEGHSGYAEAGQDILCAAVTAAVQLLECQLGDVLNLSPRVETCEERARISLSLPACNVAAAQPALRAFALVARQWADRYPDHISFQEVQ